jgi:hypothetical protein
MADENRVFLSHTNRTFEHGAIPPPCHDGSYVQHDTVCLLYGFSHFLSENLIFSPLFAYSTIPGATRNTLKPPSLVYNLHAT